MKTTANSVRTIKPIITPEAMTNSGRSLQTCRKLIMNHAEPFNESGRQAGNCLSKSLWLPIQTQIQCHLETAAQRRDSHASREQTRSADQRAYVQAAVMDAMDCAEISGMPRELPFEFLRAAPNRDSRSGLFLWTSRTSLKVAICDYGDLPGVGFETCSDLVSEF